MKTGYAIRVMGKVQNVGFRYYTEKTAREFNISGFVRNEPGGGVYIEAEGESDALESFMSWCRRGPQWARVDRFEVQDQPVMGYSGFKVR
jgi:acylphosphatase